MLRNYERWYQLDGSFYIIQLLVTILDSTFRAFFRVDDPGNLM